MSFRNSCSESVVMSGLRSSCVFALRLPRLSGARSISSAAAVAGSMSSTSSISDLLEEPVQLLDVGLVQIELGRRHRYLGVGEHAHLLALRQAGP